MEFRSNTDSYTAIRKIGEGGFGVVYLVQDSQKRFYALKEVHNPDKNSHEAHSLKLYADSLKHITIDALIPIERIFQNDKKLCYTMPLADGVEEISPIDENWRPKTLAWLVEERRKSGKWFSKDEVLEIFIPIVKAVDALTSRGLLHRDIKPANILFFDRKACLADIGLMAEDTSSVSSAGTPDYAPPQWYLQNHGHPDMWGLAATLFTLITGNHPDMMGRAAYFWPPCGKSCIDANDVAAWEGFHRIIARATREKAKDRYLRIDDFEKDLERVLANEQIQENQAQPAKKTHGKSLPKIVFIAAAICAAVGLGFWYFGINENAEKEETIAPPISKTTAAIERPKTREEMLEYAGSIASEINALKNESNWEGIVEKFPELQKILTGILPGIPSVQLGANLYLLNETMSRDNAVQCYRNAVQAYAKTSNTDYALEIANAIAYFWECVNAVSEPSIPEKAGFIVNQSIIAYERFFDRAVLINDPSQFEDAYENLALALKEYGDSYYRARIVMAKVTRSGKLVEEDFEDSDLVYGNKIRDTLLELNKNAPDFIKWLKDNHPQMVKFLTLMGEGKIKIYQYNSKEFNQAEDI